MTGNSIQTIKAIQIPPVTAEFAETITKVFPKMKLKDDSTLIAIGRDAGRQEVIDFINRSVVKRTVSGNPDDIIRNTFTGWMKRLFAL